MGRTLPFFPRVSFSVPSGSRHRVKTRSSLTVHRPAPAGNALPPATHRWNGRRVGFSLKLNAYRTVLGRYGPPRLPEGLSGPSALADLFLQTRQSALADLRGGGAEWTAPI